MFSEQGSLFRKEKSIMGITIGEFLQIFIDVVMALIDLLGIDLGDINLGGSEE